MELRHLRYFKAVAELLNFSRAAEQLRVAQSALSRQIQALEDDVGAKLLDRNRAHVALTDAGKSFYTHTCKLLLHADIAITEARQIARGASGEFVVCSDWRMDAHFVSATIDEFRRKNPRVEIMLRDAGDNDQIALIRSSQAHLGFVAREFLGKNSELEFLPIRRVSINVILPASHPLAKREAVRLADLAKETWVDASEAAAARFKTFFVQQCRLSGYSPRIGKTATTLDALFGHVASGYGISAVPDYLRPHRGAPLSSVRSDCTPIEFGAVWRSNNKSPLLQQFIEILSKQITSPKQISSPKQTNSLKPATAAK